MTIHNSLQLTKAWQASGNFKIFFLRINFNGCKERKKFIWLEAILNTLEIVIRFSRLFSLISGIHRVFFYLKKFIIIIIIIIIIIQCFCYFIFLWTIFFKRYEYYECVFGKGGGVLLGGSLFLTQDENSI